MKAPSLTSLAFTLRCLGVLSCVHLPPPTQKPGLRVSLPGSRTQQAVLGGAHTRQQHRRHTQAHPVAPGGGQERGPLRHHPAPAAQQQQGHSAASQVRI